MAATMPAAKSLQLGFYTSGHSALGLPSATYHYITNQPDVLLDCLLGHSAPEMIEICTPFDLDTRQVFKRQYGSTVMK